MMNRLVRHAPEPRDWRRLRPWRRHSLVLLVAGVVYVTLGLVLALVDPTATRESSLRGLAWAPWWWWGLLWIAVGVAAILSARWPEGADKWGYAALAGWSAGWSAAYLGGVVLGAGAAALNGVLVYALLAVLWWAISGLVNPEDFPTWTDESD